MSDRLASVLKSVAGHTYTVLHSLFQNKSVYQIEKELRSEMQQKASAELHLGTRALVDYKKIADTLGKEKADRMLSLAERGFDNVVKNPFVSKEMREYAKLMREYVRYLRENEFKVEAGKTADRVEDKKIIPARTLTSGNDRVFPVGAVSLEKVEYMADKIEYQTKALTYSPDGGAGKERYEKLVHRGMESLNRFVETGKVEHLKEVVKVLREMKSMSGNNVEFNKAIDKIFQDMKGLGQDVLYRKDYSDAGRRYDSIMNSFREMLRNERIISGSFEKARQGSMKYTDTVKKSMDGMSKSSGMDKGKGLGK